MTALSTQLRLMRACVSPTRNGLRYAYSAKKSVPEWSRDSKEATQVAVEAATEDAQNLSIKDRPGHSEPVIDESDKVFASKRDAAEGQKRKEIDMPMPNTESPEAAADKLQKMAQDTGTTLKRKPAEKANLAFVRKAEADKTQTSSVDETLKNLENRESELKGMVRGLPQQQNYKQTGRRTP